MAVLVDFALVPCVNMIMSAVFPNVVMGMPQRIARMLVGVLVLVRVFVGVSMRVFMDVLFVSVCMLMRVSVGMLVGVGMAVFMIAVHFLSSLDED